MLRHRPRLYLASVREGWRIYLRSPSDLRFLGAENLGALQPASDLYDAVFFLRRRGLGSGERHWAGDSPSGASEHPNNRSHRL